MSMTRDDERAMARLLEQYPDLAAQLRLSQMDPWDLPRSGALMASLASGPGFGLVSTPPADAPVIGLIPALQGTPFLLDDTGEPVDGGFENDPAQPDDTGNTRWWGGVRYQPEQTCYAAGVQNPCNLSFAGMPPEPTIVDFMPYFVWAGSQCSSIGWNARNYKGRATRALLASESKQISHELWSGKQAQLTVGSGQPWPNNWLASPLAFVLSSGPQNVPDALAFLEQGLADASNGQRGAIHCTRQLGARWSELGNTFRASTSSTVLTYMGTTIIPDAGYDGSGPAGQPAVGGSQWAYATLMPTVRRESSVHLYPDDFSETSVHTSNTITWYANRLAVATFSPCVLLACEVDVPLPTGGVS